MRFRSALIIAMGALALTGCPTEPGGGGGRTTTTTTTTTTAPPPQLVYTGTADKNIGCYSGVGGDDKFDQALGSDGHWSFYFQGCTAFSTETVAFDAQHGVTNFVAPTGYQCRMSIDGTSDATGWWTNPHSSPGGTIFLSSSSTWPDVAGWTITCDPL